MNPDFDIFPKVVSVGVEATISICGPDENTCGRHEDRVFRPGERYNLNVYSKVDHSDEDNIEIEASKYGILKFRMRFNTQGEYFIHLSKKGAEDRPISEEHIFAVSPDMMEFRPYKGDLHIHTNHTDGQRSPIHMAIKAKDFGMDFIAITDHDRYFPSVEAIKRAEEINMNLIIFNGEEISVEDSAGSGGHVVSLCASEHVKGRFAPDRESQDDYQKEIKAIIDNDLKDKKLVECLSKEKYAHMLWTMKKIREYGGYILLGHPYWEYPKGKYYLDRLVFDQLIADELFDFVEISVNTDLAVAKCHQEAIKGRKLIPVCTSDAHRFERRFGIYYTIIFAPKLDKEHIFEALFDSKCVAVGHNPDDYERLTGDFDLVEYTGFLIREFFPLHDRVCGLESELYRRVIDGEDARDPMLDRLKTQLEELYAKYWA